MTAIIHFLLQHFLAAFFSFGGPVALLCDDLCGKYPLMRASYSSQGKDDCVFALRLLLVEYSLSSKVIGN